MYIDITLSSQTPPLRLIYKSQQNANVQYTTCWLDVVRLCVPKENICSAVIK
jgi:hypothetical protein